MFNVEIV